MINTLRMALKVDLTYAINSHIYRIKKLPILRDLLNDDVYKGQGLKKIARFISIFLSVLRLIGYRLLYFFILYFISDTISPNNIAATFIHIYFIFTIIGMFINNKLLIATTKKYFSIILFNMDAKEFMRASLLLDLGLSCILNSIGFLVLSLFLNYSLWECFILILFSILARIVGEAISVYFYKKTGYVFTANYKNTLVVLGVFLIVAFFPILKITISDIIINSVVVVFLILGIFAYRYLMNVNDYKLIYKKINTEKMAMNSGEAASYARQNMVQIKNKDKNIDQKKLVGKTGYDLFNTIFFERHREILMRSAKSYSILAFIGIVILAVLSFYNKQLFDNIHEFILNRLGWFVIIMYFINRGSIITQAMFYNCDHAMLNYNFYREPDVIVNLFKKRLSTVIKVNLLPAIVIALGCDILLYITGGSSIINFIMIPLFIVILSVFFSVHYLVIYYLMQPYNKDLEIKSFSYTFVSLITYVVCYFLSDVQMSSLYFSMIGLIFTIVYIVISLRIVYRRAPFTFKINK